MPISGHNPQYTCAQSPQPLHRHHNTAPHQEAPLNTLLLVPAVRPPVSFAGDKVGQFLTVTASVTNGTLAFASSTATYSYDPASKVYTLFGNQRMPLSVPLFASMQVHRVPYALSWGAPGGCRQQHNPASCGGTRGPPPAEGEGSREGQGVSGERLIGAGRLQTATQPGVMRGHEGATACGGRGLKGRARGKW